MIKDSSSFLLSHIPWVIELVWDYEFLLILQILLWSHSGIGNFIAYLISQGTSISIAKATAFLVFKNFDLLINL